MLGFRPEIQTLRALAVMLVVVFHLWPTVLTGGYVGVDVFFGISGYLITGHLLRESEKGDTVDLRAFWARRIRRLLPAAALVLAATLVATLLFAPGRVWQETARQIGASAVGAENWVLALDSVDYFGQNNVPTAVQHYWSLSLEEQFYVMWPVLLVIVLLLARRRGGTGTRALPIAMGAVFAASLAWSVYSTATSQSTAYFSTFSHGWEFAFGGLVAFAVPRLASTRWERMHRTRGLATWAGLAAIVASAVVFTGASPFPGWIALLPIVGTMLVIVAGGSPSRLQAGAVLFSRPVQFVGSVSYSTYLWHWPLIVVLPQALGREIGLTAKLAILVVSILLGWLTKRFVEDPARTSPFLARRKVATYALGIVLASALVVSAGITWSVGGARAAEAQAQAASTIESALDGGNPCFGAAAMLSACPDSHVVDSRFGPDFAADDWGSIAGVTKDGTLPDKSACVDFSTTGAGFLDCRLGATTSETTLAIVGDSHALAVTEPFVRIAEAEGWAVRVILRNSCTPSLPMPYSGTGTKADCNDWRQAMADRIAADPDIDVVVATGFTRGEPEAVYAGTADDLVRGYADLWREWAATGKTVIVMGDVPLTNGQSVPECVASHLSEADPCAVPRDAALAYDPLGDSVAAAADERVSLLDVTDAFCDPALCHSVIGGLIAYRDPHHLSATFALTLVPRFRESLQAAGY